MSTATATTTAPPSRLVPLYVDVTEGTDDIRLVETILFDPTCWPLSSASVEQNAQELAHSLISDMEVHGMGRTVRHFTGRVDLYSKSLQSKVAHQLQSQLESIRDNGYVLSSLRKKRKRTTTTTATEDNDKAGVEEAAKDEDDETKAKKEDVLSAKPETSSSSLIKIRIRLSVNGVMVMDDFDWDPQLGLCPIAFSQQLAKDLNLPEEGAVAIATSLIEQLQQTAGDEVDDNLMKGRTSAWTTDQREQIANVAHVVAQHRPTDDSK